MIETIEAHLKIGNNEDQNQKMKRMQKVKTKTLEIGEN